jgi:hypothetical protein
MAEQFLVSFLVEVSHNAVKTGQLQSRMGVLGKHFQHDWYVVDIVSAAVRVLSWNSGSPKAFDYGENITLFDVVREIWIACKDADALARTSCDFFVGMKNAWLQEIQRLFLGHVVGVHIARLREIGERIQQRCQTIVVMRKAADSIDHHFNSALSSPARMHEELIEAFIVRESD